MQRRFAYDEIAAQPLAQLRQAVAGAFRSGKMTESFPQVVDRIEKYLETHAPEWLPVFSEEKTKIYTAAQRGMMVEPPRLDRPELQLLWGAALGALSEQMRDPRNPLQNSDAWKQVAASDVLEEERRFCAQAASALPGLRDRQGNLLVEWGAPLRGYPDLGFYCDPVTGTVHLDMIWTLITGVEPSRSLMLREAAHGLGTLYFTEEMQRIRAEMIAIKAEENRTPEQHTRMIHLAAQWLARYDVTVEAENNFACRFAADRAKVSAQDYAASLNYAEAVTGNIPEAARFARTPVTGPVPVKARFGNVLRALHHSFFRNNGLFPDTEEGWQSAGVRPEWIETADGSKKGMAALSELADMCHEMEKLQPDLRDRSASDAWHAQKMDECSRARCVLAEKIFDRFVSHMVPELELEAEKNPDETMDRMEQLTGGDPQPGQDGQEPGEGRDPSEDETSVDGKKERDSRIPPKNPREAKGLPSEGDPQPGEGEPGEGEPGEGEGEPGPGEGEGEGEGEPGEGEGEGDGDGDGEEKEPEEKDPHESDPKDGEGGRDHGDSFNNNGPQDPEDDGSFNEYQRIIGPHGDAIREATAVMKKIQEKLIIRIQEESRKNSLVPEDGDVGRFQSDALKDRLIKQFSGQAIDESDFETFRMDGPIRTISPPTEIHIWIDGSGSMAGEPVEMAITTGCILYEAAKEAGMEVYITMLGDPAPLPIARPGMSNREIGKAITSVREGQGGDKDYLAPTLDKMIRDTIGKKRKLNEPVGNTHCFVVSDGMFTDQANALELVQSVNKNVEHATLDFALINARGGMGAGIEKVAQDLNAKSDRARIGYTHVFNAGEIHNGIMTLLNGRLKDVRPGDAIPLAKKQKEFKTVKLKDQYRRGR